MKREGVRGWPCKGTAPLELHDGSNCGWLRECGRVGMRLMKITRDIV